MKNLEELIVQAQKMPPLKLAVAAAGDETVLASVKMAHELGIIEPILIGDEFKIKKALKTLAYQDCGQIIPSNSDRESAHKAMQLIVEGKAELPMKGLLNTKTILQALLAPEYNLRMGRLLSLVTVIYLEKEQRLVLMSDGGMNIAPDLEDKIAIINNAVEVARILGMEKPKVAPLAAVETVNPAMPATMEAAALSKMAERGQIKNCLIDGPLALDNAISLAAAEHKGINSPVAGQADILLVPDIEAGNILYKALIYYAGLEAASLVYGAKVPLVLTSRADDSATKLKSIALAKLVAREMKKN